MQVLCPVITRAVDPTVRLAAWAGRVRLPCMARPLRALISNTVWRDAIVLEALLSSPCMSGLTIEQQKDELVDAEGQAS